jgi:4-hydroxybenzoate polyprenyltransferase
MVGCRRIIEPQLLIPALLLAWQLITLNPAEAENAKLRFIVNGWVGFALTVAFLLEAWF